MIIDMTMENPKISRLDCSYSNLKVLSAYHGPGLSVLKRIETSSPIKPVFTTSRTGGLTLLVTLVPALRTTSKVCCIEGYYSQLWGSKRKCLHHGDGKDAID